MSRFIPLAVAAFLGIFALVALSFSAIAGVVIAGSLMAVNAVRNLLPGHRSERMNSTATAGSAFRIWNDGRGTIIDMEPVATR